MLGDNLVLDVYTSLTKIAADTIDDLLALGISDRIEFLQLDEYGAQPEFPNTDVMGLFGYNLFIGTPAEVHVKYYVSPYRDTNLFRHMRMLNNLVRRLMPMMVYPIMDSETGETYASMVICTPVIVQDPPRAESRTIQVVNLRLQLTQQPGFNQELLSI